MNIVLNIFLISVLSFFSRTCQKDFKSEIHPSPLIDSLSSEYSQIQLAVLTDEIDKFFELIDPQEVIKLKEKYRKGRYNDFQFLINQSFKKFPDLDTLKLKDIRNTNNYIRLTYVGFGTRFGYNSERVQYTFLLFRNCKNKWRFTAISSIEKERYDQYGNELSYHETELPTIFRFPRYL